MPTVILNKKTIDRLIGKKLSLDELKDRISMLGTDLNEIKDDEIHIEVFPNRPDMLSEQGLGRALASFIGTKPGLKKYNIKKSGLKIFAKDPEKKWPYVVACIVKGLELNSDKVREIIQLQEKLGTTLTRNRKKGGIGIYPLEKINFPVTFTGKKPELIKFTPLEFKKELTAQQILDQHPKGKTYKHILDTWSKYPLFIDAKGIIMSMPPIINSDIVGKITENSKNLFLEATGPDLNTLITSLNIITTSLSDLGGQIYSIEINYPKKKLDYPNLEPIKRKINLNNVNKLLGLNLSEKEIKTYLERMGYGYSNKIVSIPPYRADILNEVDLIEDIAIAYGYENFTAKIPKVSTIGQENNFEKFKEKISEFLTGFNILETNSFNLISEQDLEKMGIDIPNIKIKNPINLEYNRVRTWMIPSLLKILSENKHYEYPQNLFEIGTCFNKDNEFNRLGITLCHDKVTFTQIKQILDSLMNYLNLKYTLEETEHPSFIDGRCGRITIKSKKLAYIGEIKPEVLSKFNINLPVSALEINLTELFKLI